MDSLKVGLGCRWRRAAGFLVLLSCCLTSRLSGEERQSLQAQAPGGLLQLVAHGAEFIISLGNLLWRIAACTTICIIGVQTTASKSRVGASIQRRLQMILNASKEPIQQWAMSVFGAEVMLQMAMMATGHESGASTQHMLTLSLVALSAILVGSSQSRPSPAVGGGDVQQAERAADVRSQLAPEQTLLQKAMSGSKDVQFRALPATNLIGTSLLHSSSCDISLGTGSVEEGQEPEDQAPNSPSFAMRGQAFSEGSGQIMHQTNSDVTESVFLDAESGHPPMDSPADLILDMLGQMLEGHMPDGDELQLLHSCLNAGHDMYTPISVHDQGAMSSMDADVEEALMTRLLGVQPTRATRGTLGTTSPLLSTCHISPNLPDILEGVENLDLDPMSAIRADSALGYSSMRVALSNLISDVSALDEATDDTPRTRRGSAGTDTQALLAALLLSRSRRNSASLGDQGGPPEPAPQPAAALDTADRGSAASSQPAATGLGGHWPPQPPQPLKSRPHKSLSMSTLFARRSMPKDSQALLDSQEGFTPEQKAAFGSNISMFAGHSTRRGSLIIASQGDSIRAQSMDRLVEEVMTSRGGHVVSGQNGSQNSTSAAASSGNSQNQATAPISQLTESHLSQPVDPDRFGSFTSSAVPDISKEHARASITHTSSSSAVKTSKLSKWRDLFSKGRKQELVATTGRRSMSMSGGLPCERVLSDNTTLVPESGDDLAIAQRSKSAFQLPSPKRASQQPRPAPIVITSPGCAVHCPQCGYEMRILDTADSVLGSTTSNLLDTVSGQQAPTTTSPKRGSASKLKNSIRVLSGGLRRLVGGNPKAVTHATEQPSTIRSRPQSQLQLPLQSQRSTGSTDVWLPGTTGPAQRSPGSGKGTAPAASSSAANSAGNSTVTSLDLTRSANKLPSNRMLLQTRQSMEEERSVHGTAQPTPAPVANTRDFARGSVARSSTSSIANTTSYVSSGAHSSHSNMQRVSKSETSNNPLSHMLRESRGRPSNSQAVMRSSQDSVRSGQEGPAEGAFVFVGQSSPAEEQDLDEGSGGTFVMSGRRSKSFTVPKVPSAASSRLRRSSAVDDDDMPPELRGKTLVANHDEIVPSSVLEMRDGMLVASSLPVKQSNSFGSTATCQADASPTEQGGKGAALQPQRTFLLDVPPATARVSSSQADISFRGSNPMPSASGNSLISGTLFGSEALCGHALEQIIAGGNATNSSGTMGQLSHSDSSVTFADMLQKTFARQEKSTSSLDVVALAQQVWGTRQPQGKRGSSDLSLRSALTGAGISSQRNSQETPKSCVTVGGGEQERPDDLPKKPIVLVRSKTAHALGTVGGRAGGAAPAGAVEAAAAAAPLQQGQPRQSVGRRRSVRMQPNVIQQPSAAMLDKVERLLARAEFAVSFDSFELAEATNGHGLSALAFYLISRAQLITTFNLNPVKLARWLRHVESGYHNNPYHNATHAGDVLQTLHVTLHIGQLQPHYVDTHMLLSCYIAAVVHDYEHQGLTNDYLINTSSPLAIRYNDKAPMENHHLAAAFTTMRAPGLNFAAEMPKGDYDRMRKVVIDLVLATDMKQHFALVGHFNSSRRQLSMARSLSGLMASSNGGVEIGAPTSTTIPLSPRGSTHNSILPSSLFPANSARTSHSRSHARTSARSSVNTSGSIRSLMHTISGNASGGFNSFTRLGPGGAARLVSPQPSGLANGPGPGDWSGPPDLATSPNNLSRTALLSVPSSTEDQSMLSTSFLTSGWMDGGKAHPGPTSFEMAMGHAPQSLEATNSSNAGGTGLSHSFAMRQANASQQSRHSNRIGMMNAAEALPRLSQNGLLSTMLATRNLDGDGMNTASQQSHVIAPVDEAERMLSIQIAFKLADLGHIAESSDVHLKWVAALEEEFFRQGDKEREAGLPISPLFDRHKPGVTKSQVGFFEVVVLPLFRAFAASFPGSRPLLAAVNENYRYWRAHQPPPPTVPDGP